MIAGKFGDGTNEVSVPNLLPPNEVVGELIGQLPPHALIADLGCFNGDNAAHMAILGHTVVALDIDFDALRLGNERSKLLGDSAQRSHFVSGDIRHVPLRSGFDAVVMTNVHQMIPRYDLPQVFTVTMGLVKPGGLHAVSAYAAEPDVVASKLNYTIFEHGALVKEYRYRGWGIKYAREERALPLSDGSISSHSHVLAWRPTYL